MKIVTGHQPVYLPWLGLLHKISLADVYIFMDDVQYLRGDWNNRNRIKTPNGASWLTVPVALDRSSSPILKDIRIDDSRFGQKGDWQIEHWRTLERAYRRAPHWDSAASFFEDVLTRRRWRWLAELNQEILLYLIEFMGFSVEFVRASEARFQAVKSDLVLEHCTRFGAGICVLGQHGRDYLRVEDFSAAGIFTYFQDYRHPTYPQRFGDFISHLSAVDVMFNCGKDSVSVICGDNVTRAALERAASAMAVPGEIDEPGRVS